MAEVDDPLDGLGVLIERLRELVATLGSIRRELAAVRRSDNPQQEWNDHYSAMKQLFNEVKRELELATVEMQEVKALVGEGLQ